ncbi:MAG: hypothetical protein HOW73_10600 [Polyangiaceae bacterium]|nr:hypothetical protein [Polyangiaceae bacterium]
MVKWGGMYARQILPAMFVFVIACGDDGGNGAMGAGGSSSGGARANGGSANDGGGTSGGGGQSHMGGAGGGEPPVLVTDPLPLTETDSFYPRAIRLGDGTVIASVVAPQPSGRLGGTIFESTDEGVTFTEIGHVDDPIAGGGLCCATLFELPAPLGSLEAGTLLWSASAGGDTPDEPMSLPLYSSSDRGKTWTYLSTVVVADVPRSEGGLWEPELTQLDDGRLVCYWSDETDPNHSQKLVAARSSDAVSWAERHDVVATNGFAGRPGMPVVRRAVSGEYLLSYELCGTDGCANHMKRSSDGWTFGAVTDPGPRPSTMNGEHFRHAPTLAAHPSPGDSGRLYLVGQLLYTGEAQTAGSGTVILASTEGGYGNWYKLAAPVPVPEAYDNFCPNYSSPLLPLDGGASVLELASKWVDGHCRTYFAKGRLGGTGDAAGLAAGRYRLRSLISGHCLDVAGGSVESGANVQQWACNGLAPQAWDLEGLANDVASLRSAQSGFCLSAQGTEPGANVAQLPCDGGTRWKLENVGLDAYRLVEEASGLCLDVAGGSADAGANVQLWSCNDLAPQVWIWSAD